MRRDDAPNHRTNRERQESIVFVIDDDVSMRTTLSSLFRRWAAVELFGSAHEFAQIKMPVVASCWSSYQATGVSGLASGRIG